MKSNISDNFVDLTVTSPPYDNLRTYKGFVFDYKSMLKELYRVTKNGGVVVWIVNDKTHKGSETGTSFKHALYAKDVGFNLHDTMIYAKNNPVPQIKSKRYTNAFEYMFVLSKGTPNTCNYLKEKTLHPNNKHIGKNQKSATSKENIDRNINRVTKEFKIKSNIWFYNIGINQSSKDKVTNKHPAIFPEALAQDHILTWSNEGDIVLDPMCGAGTTCKMAWLNNRKFIGIDISEEYINDICIPRLKAILSRACSLSIRRLMVW
ncbi:MAG TPA: site-specific DNA-methyltransferase [Thermoanaerobacterales bacterium]|nr:site-specific DNA-methyltransferase [Thermoanaerobacterales bacterium]